MDLICGLIAVLISVVCFILGVNVTDNKTNVNKSIISGGSDLPSGSHSTLTYGQLIELEYPYRKYFATKNDLDTAMTEIANAKLELSELEFIIPMLDLEKSQLTFNNDGVVSQWVIDDPSNDFNEVGFVSDYFNHQCRVDCKRYNEKFTPREFWSHNKRKIISECEKKYKKLTWHNIEETIYSMCKGCTTFRPKLLSSFINHYKPKSILDISSGWGDRLVAAIATKTEYLGCDPNSCLHPGYKSMIKMLGNSEKLPNGKPKYQVLHDKFQECKIPSTRMFDMVFTSPPYFDVEEYTSESTQSIKEFNTVDKWFDGFLKPSLDKAWSHLNTSGLLVLHINNTPGKPDYVIRMRDYINTYADSEYLGVMGKVTNGDGKRARPIWIWKKLISGSSEPTVIQKEYQGYLNSLNIRKLISQYGKHRAKLEQLIERWFLININETKSHKKFCETADDMFIQTCREKNIMRPNAAEKFLESMKNAIAGEPKLESHKLGITESSNEYSNITKFIYGRYTFELVTSRVEAIRKHAKAHGLNEDQVNERIMACALRYASIFAYGRQWCANIGIYEDAAADGATIEGMASPFNAQILLVDGVLNPKFCSLFPDIEGPLGSIGSFFDCDFENSHVVVNPPRVEEVIQNVVDYCIEQVHSRKCKFTMVLPLWEDAKYFKDLHSNTNTVITYLDMDKYYSEDPFNGEIKKATGFKFIKVVIGSM